MSARSKARKRALDALYAAELRGRPATEELDEFDGVVNEHTRTLVDGVVAHAARLDEIIAQYSEGWTLDRMPAVDRNILRIGIFELLFVDDVPDAVAISEAVNLARELSTDDSAGFVNGILGNVSRDRERLTS
ncbi:MAG TPA: transcription antitermination factor NusB [Marmoricola sp.]